MLRNLSQVSIVSFCTIFPLLLFTSGSYAQKVNPPNICDKFSEFIEEENEFSPQESQEICEIIIRVLQEKAKEEEVTITEEESTKAEILERQAENPTSPNSLFFNRAEDSLLDRAAISPKSAVEFNASTDKSNVALRLGQEISSGKKGEFSSWSLTASSPINKQDEDNNTELATLDGLSNAFRMKFNYTNFILTGRKNPFPQFKDQLDKICKLASIDPGKEDCGTSDVIEGLKKTDLSKLEQSKIVDEFNSYFVDSNSWNITYGLNGSVGYENFEFLNSETLQKEDQVETPWSAGGFFGFTPPKLNALFLIGADYQSAFKTSSTKTICPVLDTTDSVTCTTGIVGGPNQQDKALVYIEGRGKLITVAFSLRVTYDFENENTGIDLPIYIFPDKDGNLNGGLRLGWTDANDDNDLTFGVFVGNKFKLFD